MAPKRMRKAFFILTGASIRSFSARSQVSGGTWPNSTAPQKKDGQKDLAHKSPSEIHGSRPTRMARAKMTWSSSFQMSQAETRIQKRQRTRMKQWPRRFRRNRMDHMRRSSTNQTARDKKYGRRTEMATRTRLFHKFEAEVFWIFVCNFSDKSVKICKPFGYNFSFKIQLSPFFWKILQKLYFERKVVSAAFAGPYLLAETLSPRDVTLKSVCLWPSNLLSRNKLYYVSVRGANDPRYCR